MRLPWSLDFSSEVLERKFLVYTAPARAGVLVVAIAYLANTITRCILNPTVNNGAFGYTIWVSRLVLGGLMLFLWVLDSIMWAQLRLRSLSSSHHWSAHHYLRIAVIYILFLTNSLNELDFIQCSYWKGTPMIRCFERIIIQSLSAMFAALVITITVTWAFIATAFLVCSEIIIYNLPGVFVNGQPAEQRYGRPMVYFGCCFCFSMFYWWREKEDRRRFLALQELERLGAESARQQKNLALVLSSVCDPNEMKVLVSGGELHLASDSCTVVCVTILDFVVWRQRHTPWHAVTLVDGFHVAVDDLNCKLGFLRLFRHLDQFGVVIGLEPSTHTQNAPSSGTLSIPDVGGQGTNEAGHAEAEDNQILPRPERSSNEVSMRQVQVFCRAVNRIGRPLNFRFQYGIATGRCEVRLTCGMTMHRVLGGKAFVSARSRSRPFRSDQLSMDRLWVSSPNRQSSASAATTMGRRGSSMTPTPRRKSSLLENVKSPAALAGAEDVTGRPSDGEVGDFAHAGRIPPLAALQDKVAVDTESDDSANADGDKDPAGPTKDGFAMGALTLASSAADAANSSDSTSLEKSDSDQQLLTPTYVDPITGRRISSATPSFTLKSRGGSLNTSINSSSDATTSLPSKYRATHDADENADEPSLLTALVLPEDFAHYADTVIRLRSPLVHATWFCSWVCFGVATIFMSDWTEVNGPRGKRTRSAFQLLWIWLAAVCVSLLTVAAQLVLQPILNLSVRWILLIGSAAQAFLQVLFVVMMLRSGYFFFDLSMLYFPMATFVVTSLDGVPLPFAGFFLACFYSNYLYWFGSAPQSPLSAPDWLWNLTLMILFYPTLVGYRFTSMRDAFYNLKKQQTLSAKAERDREAHQKAMRLFLPRYILPIVMEKLGTPHPRAVADILPDAVLLTLRLPQYDSSEQQLSLLHNVDTILQRFRGFSEWSQLEDQGIHSEQLLCMECQEGDIVRMGGPLRRPNEELAHLPLRSMGVADQWIHDSQPEEVLSNSASIILIQVLSEVMRLIPTVSGVLHREEGLAVVIGAARPTFSIEGVVRERSDAVLFAQDGDPAGQVSVTEAFLIAFTAVATRSTSSKQVETRSLNPLHPSSASGHTCPFLATTNPTPAPGSTTIQELYPGTDLEVHLGRPLKHRVAHLGFMKSFPLRIK